MLNSNIQKISDQIWVINAPFSLFKTDVGIRSTIIKLSTNKIIIHSPINFTKDQIEFITNLGDVSDIIAPNCFHYLFLDTAASLFPQTKIHIAPGLEKKVSHFDTVLNINNTYSWSSEINVHFLDGMPKMNEFIFFHHQSKTLIFTDSFFNIPKSNSLWTRVFWSLLGVYNNCSQSKRFHLLVKNKTKLTNSIRPLFNYNISNLIFAHGEVLLSEPKRIKLLIQRIIK